MAESSHRAASARRRGGLPNALFVVAAAESLPAELDGVAESLTVHFPWGSLLQGLLRADPAILDGMRSVCRIGAPISLLLSVTERDHLAGIASFDRENVERMAGGFAAHKLALIEHRPATAQDLDAAHSTWARRLDAGRRRPVWLLRFVRST